MPYEDNHYVPQWYQHRFLLPNQTKFNYYLDMKPEKVLHSDGGFHYRSNKLYWSPKGCFSEKDLYTRFYGKKELRNIETDYFNKLDKIGFEVIPLFTNYSIHTQGHASIKELLFYMGAQQLRTPKGLDFIELRSIADRNSRLNIMVQTAKFNSLIWAEGIFEIVSCKNSSTKFIVTDHPVCTYNKKLFPSDPECTYPYEPQIHRIGTQTLFPLDLEHCLIITNLAYVRNPKVNLLKDRINYRYFGRTIFDLRKIQFGRDVPETHVLGINHILKCRARRFIASAKSEWLYPEKYLNTAHWDKLGDFTFLMPDPRKMRHTFGTFIGYENGTSWGSNEYGEHFGNDESGDSEAATFFEHERKWVKHFGELPDKDDPYCTGNA